MYIDILKYNFPKFRQNQLNNAIFKNFSNSFDEISTLPNDIKEILKRDFVFPSIQSVKETKNSEVFKKLFQTQDGKLFEAVLLLHKKNRQTVCVSSQVGCPVGCKFCATGQLGFERNLSYQEIVDQILHFARILKQKDLKVTNIVFMGMGEPFFNLENLEKSISILTNPDEFNFSSRRITVSTVWTGYEVVDFVKKNPQINIAVSLHSAVQEKRRELIPLAEKVTLDEIESGIKKCLEVSNRRITLEYLLLEGVNDSVEDADELVEFIMRVNRKLLHVNLLPYNEIEGVYKSTKTKKLFEFKEYLESKKINVTIRKSMGQEIASACGMLKGDS
jgi:23S rRNA (adenine2503-C2)-methyltransferase